MTVSYTHLDVYKRQPRGLAEDATDEEKAAAKKAVKESQKEFTKKLASYEMCIRDSMCSASVTASD